MSYTDFTKFSHGELRRMAQALNSGEVMAASDPWRRASDTLKAIRATLTTASTEAAVTWEGATSDAFHARMLHLANTINTAASFANDAAITLKAMSEAIDQAKRNMPEEPSNWEQVKDGVGDTVSSIFGGDDEDTKTPVADQKKAEAAAVMQTLAMRYRVAGPMLKPPPPPPPPPTPNRKGDDYSDVPTSGDPSGSAALSAVMSSASYTGTRPAPVSTSSPAPRPQKPVDQPTSKRSTSTPPDLGTRGGTAPADSGIKGGTAQPAPKPPSVTHYGPGTGIDGTTITNPTTPVTSTSSTNPGTSSTNLVTPGGPQGGQPGGLPPGLKSSGPGNGPRANGGGPVVGRSDGPAVGQGKSSGAQGKDGANRTSAPGQAATRGGKAFGTGEAYGGGFGSGGRAAAGARPGGGLPGRTGGVVGEGGRTGAGAGAKQAFTEGGSGLGARGRTKGELGANVPGGTGPGVPLADGQRRKKDKDKDGKRPDYLVEDEETWASDQPVNPNVVE
ncbi:hypothetical protein ACIGZJ_24595 [Kitasatospora sp. NPDC052868]|uniref:WXG100 family type VII secretion target n=1 Tax=Kitasatospora sp. NPDC052868 TaxID=3364060 RepID=UPI0037CC5F3A